MFYKKIVINGTEYPFAVNITGSGIPTEDTEADVGMLYMNTDNGDLYKRTPNGWELVAEKIELAQTTGTSETAVMSQKVVTKELDSIETRMESFAGALKGKVSNQGQPSGDKTVSIKGVSSVEHDLKVMVRGKNLIRFDLEEDLTMEKVGVTCTFKTDGSIVLNGTPTGNADFDFVFKEPIHLKYINSQYGSPNTYTLSYGTDISGFQDSNTLNYALTVMLFDDRYYWMNTPIPGTSATFTIGATSSDKVKLLRITVQNVGGFSFNNLVLKPQLEEGSSATTYVSGDTSNIKLDVYGNNFLPFPYSDPGIVDNKKEMNGITYIINQDGTINVTGYARDDSYLILQNGMTKPWSHMTGSNYILSGGATSENCYLTVNDSGRIYTDTGYGTPPLNGTNGFLMTIRLCVPKGKYIYGQKAIKPLLEPMIYDIDLIDALNPPLYVYEPYIKPVRYSVNKDGTVDGLKSIYPSMTILATDAKATITVEYNKDINKKIEEIEAKITALSAATI